MNAAVEALLVSEFVWSGEDHAEDKRRITEGSRRLEGWARWSRDSGIRTDYPRASSFVCAMTPPPVEEQSGARHVAVEATDEEALAVDRILARWRITRRRYWKIIRVEYMTGGSSEQKARRCGFGSRADYRKRLERVQALIAEMLDAGSQ